MPHVAHHPPVLLYACLAVLGAFLFGLIPLFIPKPERFAHLLVGFAAGAVLGISLFHLLPDAISNEGGVATPIWQVALWTLAGIGLMYFIEHVLLPHEHHHLHQSSGHDGHDYPHVAKGEVIGELSEEIALEPSDLCQVCDIGFYSVASFIGLSIHSFVDGLTFAVLGQLNAATVAFLGVGLHKLAESFVLTTIFHLAGYRRGQTAIILAVFLATTPFGALAGMGVLNNVTVSIGPFTAFAAGCLIYIAGHGLLPALWNQPRHRVGAALAAIAGAGFIYATMLVK